MRAQHNEGLAALAEVAGTDGRLAPWHLGFVLGPRINAGGRIGNAALGAELLTTDDPDEAASIAFRLDQLNGERQAMEQVMLKQAIDEADAEAGLGDGPGILVTAHDGWHAGVVGLLASRLKDRFRRPAFAIAFDDRDIGTGSARSILGVDIGRAVREAVDRRVAEAGGWPRDGGGYHHRASQTGRVSRLAGGTFWRDGAGPGGGQHLQDRRGAFGTGRDAGLFRRVATGRSLRLRQSESRIRLSQPHRALRRYGRRRPCAVCPCARQMAGRFAASRFAPPTRRWDRVCLVALAADCMWRERCRSIRMEASGVCRCGPSMPPFLMGISARCPSLRRTGRDTPRDRDEPGRSRSVLPSQSCHLEGMPYGPLMRGHRRGCGLP